MTFIDMSIRTGSMFFKSAVDPEKLGSKLDSYIVFEAIKVQDNIRKLKLKWRKIGNSFLSNAATFES